MLDDEKLALALCRFEFEAQLILDGLIQRRRGIEVVGVSIRDTSVEVVQNEVVFAFESCLI